MKLGNPPHFVAPFSVANFCQGFPPLFPRGGVMNRRLFLKYSAAPLSNPHQIILLAGSKLFNPFRYHWRKTLHFSLQKTSHFRHCFCYKESFATSKIRTQRLSSALSIELTYPVGISYTILYLYLNCVKRIGKFGVGPYFERFRNRLYLCRKSRFPRP